MEIASSFQLRGREKEWGVRQVTGSGVVYLLADTSMIKYLPVSLNEKPKCSCEEGG